MRSILENIKHQIKRISNWAFEEDDPAAVRCGVRSSNGLLDSDNALADVAKIMDKNKNLKLKANKDAQNAWQEYAKYSGPKFKELKAKTLEFRKLCSNLDKKLKDIDLNACKKDLELSNKFKKTNEDIMRDTNELNESIEFFELEHEKAMKNLSHLSTALNEANSAIDKKYKEQIECNAKSMQTLTTLKDAKNLTSIDECIKTLNELDGKGSAEVISAAQTLKEQLAQLRNAGKIPEPQDNILSKETLMDAYFSNRKSGLKNLINSTDELSDNQKKKMIEKIKEVEEANMRFENEIKNLEKTQKSFFFSFLTNSENLYTQILLQWHMSKTYKEAVNTINYTTETLRKNEQNTNRISALYNVFEDKFFKIRDTEFENKPSADPLSSIDVENSFFSGTLENQIDEIERVSSNQKKEIKGKIKSTKTAWIALKSKCENRNKELSKQQKSLEEKKSKDTINETIKELNSKIKIVDAFVSLTQNISNWENNPPKANDAKGTIRNYEKAYDLSGVLDKYQGICSTRIKKVEISEQDKEIEKKRVEHIQKLTDIHILSEQVKDLRKEIKTKISEIIQKSKDAASKGRTCFGENTALQEIDKLNTPDKAKKRLSEIITNVFVIAYCIAVLLKNCLDGNNKLKNGAAGEQLDWKLKKQFDELFDKYIITNKNYNQHFGNRLKPISKTR